ncbi:MAG: M3 family metallopeptidase [Polyangiales bacterium]
MNPLIDSLGPEAPLPFDRITAAHVEPSADALLADARAKMEALVKSGGHTWGDTMGALDAMTEKLDEAMGVAGHLEGVATTPELREAYNKVQARIAEFYSGIPLNEGLYRAIKTYAGTSEAKALTGARRRYLDKTLADFRRHGAELDAAGKERLSKIDVELTELTLKFSQNVLDSTNDFELMIDDESRLKGLPDSAKEGAKESATSVNKPGFRFTLQAPSYIPALTYLEDRAIREQLYRAFNTRATRGQWDNRPIVKRILELRREKAKLLGFQHFADLVLEDRMAKNGEAARTFVKTLHEKSQAAFAHENEELLKFAGVAALEPWDVSFWSEKQRRARYDFDDEALRPYFPLPRVLDGLFEVAHRLYGVRVESLSDASTWDPAVRAYKIVDDKGTHVASFYVDVYPRSNKRDGAWMHGLLTAWAKRPHAVEALVANVTPPVGDRPALLNHREVETMFHEFGHLLHHALGRVEVRSQGGTNVAWDFVELPSQTMENWCWEREALDLFAHHYQTGATIPEELLQKMRRARTFRAANMMMRQLGFAEVDLALHVDFDPTSAEDPIAFGRAIMSQYSAAKLPDDHAMIASFTHLFGSPVGYAAGYYSYKRAEVLDADAFSLWKERGIFSREVGDRFKNEVLSKGDSEDPALLYQRFAGRGPKLEPLLERSGLLTR